MQPRVSVKMKASPSKKMPSSAPPIVPQTNGDSSPKRFPPELHNEIAKIADGSPKSHFSANMNRVQPPKRGRGVPMRGPMRGQRGRVLPQRGVPPRGKPPVSPRGRVKLTPQPSIPMLLNQPVSPGRSTDIIIASPRRSSPRKPEIPEKPALSLFEKPPIPANKPVSITPRSPHESNPPPIPDKVVELFWPTDKTPFEQNDDSSRIIFEQNDEGKSNIKAATVEKLVEKATCSTADTTTQKTLLLTYRSMITPEELLDLLKLRFSMPLPDGNPISVESFKTQKQKPIQVRVCQFLKTWITKYYYDFENNPELEKKLLSFCSDIIKPVCTPGVRLENIVQRQMNGEYEVELNINSRQVPPKPIIPTQLNPTFFDIHPQELARQLTIIETQLFRAIRPQECIGLAWSKKNAKEKAPNILKMINRFNIVSNWAVSEILKQDTEDKRIMALNQFIEVAEYCKQLNNFNGCMEIISGLGDSAVHRLKSHWSDLPPKSRTYYNDLKIILSSEQSFKNFRAHLKSCTGACIPYLGMYLTDLTFIEDGNNDKIGDLHNFKKRMLISKVIQEIQQYQQFPYLLEKCEPIQDYLDTIEGSLFDKEACYQRSLEILPRGGKSVQISADDFGEMEKIPGYCFYEEDTPKNIILKPNEKNPQGGPYVLAGTLPKIVERLTFKDIFPSAIFTEAFLLYYRIYSSGNEVLELLIMRYLMPSPKDPNELERFEKEYQLPIRLRVVKLLKTWVDSYPGDFVENKKLRERFLKFVGKYGFTSTSLQRIGNSLEQKLKSKDPYKPTIAIRSSVSITVPPEPFPLQTNFETDTPRIFDFHPEEFARQLCIYDNMLLNRITPLSILDRLRGRITSQNITVNEAFTRIGALKKWAINQITERAVDKKVMIEFLIHVTMKCYELNNFSAVLGLLHALQGPAVCSLIDVWDEIGTQTMEELDTVRTVGCNLLTLRVFQDNLRKNCTGLPCVYPIDSYMHELSRIYSKEPDYTDDNLINILKAKKLMELINELFTSSSIPYCYKPNLFLQNYFKEEISQFSEREKFSNQIPLSSQIPQMNTEKITTAIKVEMMSNQRLYGEMVQYIKNGKNSEKTNSTIENFKEETDKYKEQIRGNLKTIAERYKRELETKNNHPFLEKYGVELESLENWEIEDKDGYVYGWNETISIKILKKDDEIFLIYQKKIFDKSELATVIRIRKLYQDNNSNSKTPKIIVIAPYINSDTETPAENFNVELLKI